jgi:hypothetical protein
MIEHEFVDVRAFGDVTDLGDIRVKLGHSLKGGAGQAVSLEVVEVSYLMDEDIGIPGESDQVFVHGGVAREDDGAVRSIETVREGRVRVSVCHPDSCHPDNPVFEYRYRWSRFTREWCRNWDVDCPNQHARVRHVAVQGHDIQVVGVTREDVLNQVRRTREGSFGVDSCVTMKSGITRGAYVRRARPIHANRGQWPVIVEANSPRIQEHAGEIAGMIDVKMRDENCLQLGEIETGRHEFGG